MKETILITGGGSVTRAFLDGILEKEEEYTLIIVDFSESVIYHLMNEVKFKKLNIIYSLTDIGDVNKIENLFIKYKPSMVIHTAAYKQLPIVENEVYEGVRNNFINTLLLSKIAEKNNVQDFLFISTDKAVEPMSIMGLTKKMVENYLLSLKSTTNYIIFRFGNIINSTGSFMPILKKELKETGRASLTSYKMERYFILSSELSISFSEFLKNKKKFSGLYVFKYRELEKVVDKILELIKLIFPNETNPSLRLLETGVRSGEKIREKLIESYEKVDDIKIKNILKVNNHRRISSAHINKVNVLVANFNYLNSKPLFNELKGILKV